MPAAANAGDARSIQWSMWANEMALCAAVVIFLGGIVGVIGGAVVSFQYWIPFGIYGIVFGIVVSMFEYPRGKKNKGNTAERSYQKFLTEMNVKIYVLTKNYYIRAVALFLICIPAGVIVPTFFGAFGLLLASIVYLVAAFRDEEWKPVGVNLPGSTPVRADTTMLPPNKPPPRLPQQV